jgi:large subunit ribosomal protein L4
MIKYKVYNQQAEIIGEQELTDEVFGLTVNPALVHQAMVAQLANTRSVIADTKDRSEVRGGGKKPWKQKGTGRARAGSSRSPIWIGGGVTFGPRKDRNFSKKLNRKMKQKAVMMALSDKIQQDSLVVIDNLEMKTFKTKDFLAVLNAFEKEILPSRRKLLLINSSKDKHVFYSGRNIKGVTIINPENINIVDLLSCRQVLISEDGIKELENKYGKNK